jgi:hypothetical protein
MKLGTVEKATIRPSMTLLSPDPQTAREQCLPAIEQHVHAAELV